MRIISMLINEAVEAKRLKVASDEDITVWVKDVLIDSALLYSNLAPVIRVIDMFINISLFINKRFYIMFT